MAVLVSSPLKRKEIKNLLTGYEGQDVNFRFVEEDGIRLYFETSGDNIRAAERAKKLITSTNWGKVLYFSSVAVE